MVIINPSLSQKHTKHALPQRILTRLNEADTTTGCLTDEKSETLKEVMEFAPLHSGKTMGSWVDLTTMS